MNNDPEPIWAGAFIIAARFSKLVEVFGNLKLIRDSGHSESIFDEMLEDRNGETLSSIKTL